MKNIPLLLLIVLTGVEAYTQDSTKIPEIKYKSKVFEATIYGSAIKENKGYLVQITDSTIALSSKPIAFHVSDLSREKLVRMGYSEIGSIKIQRKNRTARGAFVGFLIGGCIGVFTGVFMSSGSKSMISDSGSSLGMGLMAGAAGSLVGLMIGSSRSKTYHVDHSKEKLQDMRNRMLREVYVHPEPKPEPVRAF